MFKIRVIIEKKVFDSSWGFVILNCILVFVFGNDDVFWLRSVRLWDVNNEVEC